MIDLDKVRQLLRDVVLDGETPLWIRERALSLLLDPETTTVFISGTGNVSIPTHVIREADYRVGRIGMIRKLREASNLCLLDAKNAMETLERDGRWHPEVTQ